MINSTCCFILGLEDNRKGKERATALVCLGSPNLLFSKQVHFHLHLYLRRLLEIHNLGPETGSSAFKQDAQVTETHLTFWGAASPKDLLLKLCLSSSWLFPCNNAFFKLSNLPIFQGKLEITWNLWNSLILNTRLSFWRVWIPGKIPLWSEQQGQLPTYA